MSKSINRVEILGNVGKDPDIRATKTGMVIASFSIATSEGVKDDQGNWSDRTEWHNCTAFKRTAEIVRDYVKKGSKIYITGRLNTSSYEKDGVKMYSTKILVGELILLSGKDDKKETPVKQNEEPEIEDSDIPF
jgi:single-strand DNA-binding protein